MISHGFSALLWSVNNVHEKFKLLLRFNLTTALRRYCIRTRRAVFDAIRSIGNAFRHNTRVHVIHFDDVRVINN